MARTGRRSGDRSLSLPAVARRVARRASDSGPCRAGPRRRDSLRLLPARSHRAGWTLRRRLRAAAGAALRPLVSAGQRAWRRAPARSGWRRALRADRQADSRRQFAAVSSLAAGELSPSSPVFAGRFRAAIRLAKASGGVWPWVENRHLLVRGRTTVAAAEADDRPRSLARHPARRRGAFRQSAIRRKQPGNRRGPANARDHDPRRTRCRSAGRYGCVRRQSCRAGSGDFRRQRHGASGRRLGRSDLGAVAESSRLAMDDRRGPEHLVSQRAA